MRGDATSYGRLSPSDLDPETAGLPYRFLRLMETDAPTAETVLTRRLVQPYAGPAAMAELRDFEAFQRNFDSWCTPLLSHFREQRGATTPKLAASQALKAVAQSLLNRVVVNYLLIGRAPPCADLRFLPLSKAPWLELYLDPRILPEETDLDPDRGPSELFQLSIVVEEIIKVLYEALGKRKTPKPVFYSSVAIALLSPFMALRRHGAHPQDVAALMRRFLTSFGRDINGGIVWRQRQNEGRIEYAPRRKACCLKYALPDKPHLCSTCSRRPETLFFEPVEVGSAHETADGR
ncbi:hypothetical protein [Pseudovibrio exalbescens]|uniref:Ferric iron reductase FhuF-like transporter n=1 Tax=Pseudovibrio exalbescens TaxID=197461 RepID=A0A1U7JLZ5_9HYPH|nr:hypothetical protein [Pseudovibrio exalbescens]OKL45708.1 hypothetical protein A3843_01880 [Pseudovibrio exalbescens]